MSSSQCSPATCSSTKGCWCSRVRFDTVEYTWKINDFSIKNLYGATLTSPAFSAASNEEFEWILKLETRGKDGEKDNMCLFLILSKTSTRKRAFTKFSFSILSNDKAHHFSSGDTFHEFNNDAVENIDSEEDTRGWTNFLKKDGTFMDKFLQNHTLTISFHLTFFGINNESIREIFQRCNITHFQRLSQNFVSALQNCDYTDFTISVEGKDFPVHKVILASGSDYFAKMFKTSMKESRENRVEITDIDEAVMNEILRFIYTGKSENTDYLANDLLAAAEKYGLNHLKRICEDSVYKSLSVDRALNVLILSDRHNANELKLKVIDFIVDRWSQIMTSTAWNEVMLKHPKLLNEVCMIACSRIS